LHGGGSELVRSCSFDVFSIPISTSGLLRKLEVFNSGVQHRGHR
jgi:hypothetical protein